jgi:hypothetical protein
MLGSPMVRRALLPCAIFLVCALVYVAVLGEQALSPSPNNHFVHLAESFLHGQLGVVGNRAPGTNDWARFEDTWYVSFPPFPAVVIMPLVAVWHLATLDRLFWAILAGLAPALLFSLLRHLSERGQSERSTRDNLALSAMFAFGSVFLYVAVQGSVWFAAHVVASSLLILYLWCGLDAQKPLLAGLFLGLSFMTRTTTALACVFFLVEALRAHQRPSPVALPEDAHPLRRVYAFVRNAQALPVLKVCALFSLPILVCAGVQLWMNQARFHDPFSFGHEFLQIKWRGRIDRWGLFHYHYLSKNLAVVLASLPWFQDSAPYLKISLHGLALWFTSPNLLWVFWPKRAPSHSPAEPRATMDSRMVGLALAAASIALLNLCYQNSGWVQFGYRFALDYLLFVVLLIALGGRRFGPGFYACLLFAVTVNAFGALTFDRDNQFYDNDRTQNRVFQPD